MHIYHRSLAGRFRKAGILELYSEWEQKGAHISLWERAFRAHLQVVEHKTVQVLGRHLRGQLTPDPFSLQPYYMAPMRYKEALFMVDHLKLDYRNGNDRLDLHLVRLALQHVAIGLEEEFLLEYHQSGEFHSHEAREWISNFRNGTLDDLWELEAYAQEYQHRLNDYSHVQMRMPFKRLGEIVGWCPRMLVVFDRALRFSTFQAAPPLTLYLN